MADFTLTHSRMCENSIKAGYRNIDTAEGYMNEKGVGEGIRQAMDEYGLKREDIFVSTKPETHSLLGLRLGNRYFVDIWDQEPYERIKEYGKNILLIHGDRDFLKAEQAEK